MPFQMGVPELSIILVVIILLFGVGRIGRLGADFGHAISEFRKAIANNDEEKSKEIEDINPR